MLTGLNSNTAQHLQLGAGAILKTKYTTGTTLSADNILSATNGGITFSAVPTFYTPSVDGANEYTKGLKRVVRWAVTLSFTAVEADAEVIKKALGASVEEDGVITGRDVTDADYIDIYAIGEKGDGTVVQLTVKNALSTGGLNLTTANEGNGGIAFTFNGHYDLDDQETPPFEIEIIAR